MFRSLNEDDAGFVNEGLDIDDEKRKVQGAKSFAFNNGSSTRIEIIRSKYDQETLNAEMMYRKPQSKSSKCFFLLLLPVFTSRARRHKYLEIKGDAVLLIERTVNLPLNRGLCNKTATK